MKFGLFNEIQVANPRRTGGVQRERDAIKNVMDQAVHAEQAGFESVWSVEHHFLPGFSHSSAPEVIFAGISQRTSTLRLGHGVVLLPHQYNHPVRVAERVATLDIISDGRVEFGTGKSISAIELGGFGIPHDQTSALWRESLEVITGIWKSPTGTVSHQGEYLKIPERDVVPRPVQDPHPPIWTACTSDKSHTEAGALGLGLLTFAVLIRPEELGRRVALYRDAVKDATPIGAKVNNQAATFGLVHCAESNEQAKAEAERAFLSYAKTQIATSGPVLEARKTGRSLEEVLADPGFEVTDYEGIDPRDLTIDFMIENDMCVVGDPDTCVRQLEKIKQNADLDKFLCMMQFWSIPHEKTMKAIELMGEHIIPALAD